MTPAPQAPAKPSTATAPAKPKTVHLSTAYPVQKNADGTETLVKPAPTTQAAAPNAAPKTNSTSGSAVTGTGAAQPTPATQPPAATQPRPPTPPPPADPAVAAAYLAALPPARFNQHTIFIDPAHGGSDSGARIGEHILEKDVDLALAFRLKSLLQARGFTVVTTRDSDAATSAANPGTALKLDDRASQANRSGASACILIHSTASGRGVHLYTSELDPKPGQPLPAPWLSAQAAWVTQSQKLTAELVSSLARARIPLVSSRASVRPVDSLTCPALVLELAPNDSDPASINDAAYQQRVAAAIAGALVFWQNHARPTPSLQPAALIPSAAPNAGARP